MLILGFTHPRTEIEFFVGRTVKQGVDWFDIQKFDVRNRLSENDGFSDALRSRTGWTSAEMRRYQSERRKERKGYAPRAP
jgi:hypothetical protein